MTHRPKRRRQLVVALGDPSQRPHRIAHRRGLEQSLQVLQKRRVPRRQPRAPPALAAHLPGQRAGVLQILQTASDRASGDLRRARGGRDPAVAGRLRLGSGTQPSASLVKRGTKCFKSDTEGRFIYHDHDIDAGFEVRNPPKQPTPAKSQSRFTCFCRLKSRLGCRSARSRVIELKPVRKAPRLTNQVLSLPLQAIGGWTPRKTAIPGRPRVASNSRSSLR